MNPTLNPEAAQKPEKQPEADWSFLPEEMADLRQAFASPQEFWAAVGQMLTLNKERQAMGAIPGEGAAPEAWNAFWLNLGRPDKADGYQLPQGYARPDITPDLAQSVGQVMDEGRAEFMRLAHAANLTQKQAETLFTLTADSVAQSLAAQPAAPSVEEVLAQLWPGAENRHLDFARRGARYLGLGVKLDECGLSRHPLVLQLAAALGKSLAEDGLKSSSGPEASLPVGEAAYKELLRIVASDAYKRQEPATVKLAEQLCSRANMQPN